MQEIYRAIARLMGTDLTVMITGESGTGKELVARALHDFGKRRGGPFVADQHGGDPARADRERAVRPREGRLHRRHRPRAPAASSRPTAARCSSTRSATCRSRRRPGCCACCRRASSRAVGGRTPIRADVRIIAATHRDLRQLIRQGLFREDLFYRLNVVPIRLPPLRERARRHPGAGRAISSAQAHARGPAAQDARRPRRWSGCKPHRWPGNVRELENLVRRLAALYAEETIGADVIEAELRAGAGRRRPAAEAAGRRGLGGGGRAPHRRAISPRTAAACRRPASMTGCCARSSGR